MMDTAWVAWTLASLAGAPPVAEWPRPEATVVVWELEEVDGPALAFASSPTASDASLWIPGPLLPQHWVLPFGMGPNDQVGMVFPNADALARLRSDADGKPYPVDNDPLRRTPHLRKPGVEYGWDFSRPQAVQGPGSHRIRVREGAALVDPHVHWDDSTATLGRWSVEVHAAVPGSYRLQVVARWEDARGGVQTQQVANRSVDVGAGASSVVDGAFSGAEWPLWEPRPAGGRRWTLPQRVRLQWTLAIDGSVDPRGTRPVDSVDVWTGRRTVDLRTSDERPFAVDINQKPIFWAGVNAVRAQNRTAYPATSPTLAEEDAVLQQRMVEMAQNGGNAVRFWGGGRYPSERLLRCADSLGLLLWVDFSFAGTMYPSSGPVHDEMEAEVRAQIRRLSRHPSVAVVCGNNELDVAWNNWGWQAKYGIHGADSVALADGMRQFFHEWLPAQCAQGAPAVAVVPSSPLSNWGKPSDFERGNNHDWRVWHGEQPTRVLQERIAPFVTEWGVPSYPGKTVRARWVGSDDAYLFSYKGLGLLQRYLEQETPATKQQLNTSEGRARWSRRWQARVVSRTIRAQAAQPSCGGSLVWQLNDLDDAISWSLIDADNRPKPAWRAAKKAWRKIRRS
jgi:beta-mannosidase